MGAAAADVDWRLVATLRARASDLLSQATAGERLDKENEEQLGRSIVLDLIEAAMAEDANTGRPVWSPARQRATANAVFDSLFRLGRLQPLVDDDRVENIIITGYDHVVLDLVDGSRTDGPPVADSDEELLTFLQFLASRSEVNARPFSEAAPSLHLRLDGGARLAALAWVTPRPSVVIRRHRLIQVTLDDLVARGLMSDVARSFLAAAVRARKAIVVAGDQGAGKTTLMRALCAEIPYDEILVTIETEYELQLHLLPEQHRMVHPIEARPGSGERGPDGRAAGEYSLFDGLYDSFRLDASRQIIGEVRGKEIWPMIQAMESSSGSMCTTHATSAAGALEKLASCAQKEAPGIEDRVIGRKLASTIDLVVYIDLRDVVDADGTRRRQRRITEIDAVSRGERDTGYALTHVFRNVERGGVACPHTLPDDLRELEDFGFDLAGYLASRRRAS
ncbi:CpaF family protein [Xylanimonas allomyrinae]|uniref:CpaF family protein n=2 Tax=Xylanimonas allomyrinae TaxID=2509459 RepID=A0A4P6EPW7_9MICO|nr:CpaF family protein [Xylanimonas allomyrinae]